MLGGAVRKGRPAGGHAACVQGAELWDRSAGQCPSSAGPPAGCW